MKYIKGKLLPLNLIVIIALFSFGFTCENFQKSDSPIIARVGKSVLTLEDLNQSIPESYSNQITKKQRINYVKQWVDTELLYQTAIRKKIDKEKIIKNRLIKMKKDLLSSEMITRLANGISEFSVSEDEISNYYNANSGSFIRENNVVKYLEIIVDNLKIGWKVRNLVTNTNFNSLAQEYSTIPVQTPESVQFISENEIPKQISDIVFRIRVNGTTSPVQLDDGIHIIRVLDKQYAGEVATIEEVRDEILTTLSAKKQREKMEFLLSDIRNKADYEFNFDIITKNRPVKAEPIVKKIDSASVEIVKDKIKEQNEK